MEELYKSKVKWYYVVLMIIGSIVCLLILYMLIENAFPAENITDLIVKFVFIILLTGISIYLMLETLKLKSIEINKEYLVLHYFFLNSKSRLKWEDISNAKVKFSSTSETSSFNLKELKYTLYFSGKKVIIYSNNYVNPLKLSSELNKRLPSMIKSNMREGLKEQKNKLEADERKYKKQFKYVVLILILILFVIFYFL